MPEPPSSVTLRVTPSPAKGCPEGTPVLSDGLSREKGRASPSPPLVTVAKLESAVRLVAVDRAGCRLGLRAGMALADARAMHPALLVADADIRAEAELLAAIVDWTRRLTPLAALDASDGAMLDIAGCAHLFGGEAELVADIEARLAAQGFVARAAVADTPEGAWALARFSDVKIAPTGADAADLARLYDNLPLAALRIEPDDVSRFAQAGLRRIGDIAFRPRAPIAARFGPNIFAHYDALKGLAKTPISPRFEAPAYVAERRFADGIARREDVEGTIAALAGDLARMLERHGEGARELRVTLFRVDGAVRHLSAGTSSPLREPRTIVRLFRERLAAVEESEEGLDTGYGFDVVRLAAMAVEPFATPQAALTAETVPGDLAELVDRLGARLGLARVTRLVEEDTHIPEFGVRAVQASTSPLSPRSGERAGVRGSTNVGYVSANLDHWCCPSSDPASLGHLLPARGEKVLSDRPIRLLAAPEPIDAIAAVPDGPPVKFRWRRVLHELAAVEGPERIAPEWWKPRARTLTRDYFCAEDTGGRRFWLYREGLFSCETESPRWYLHGLFG